MNRRRWLLLPALVSMVLWSVLTGFRSVGPVPALQTACQAMHLDVSAPLNDLGNHQYVRMDGQNTGAQGGLYPNGSNRRPAAHESSGIALAQQVTPIGPGGAPDLVDGKVVMISVGMSNTSSEFLAFIDLANADAELNPQLAIVNGAQGGQASDAWVDPEAEPWQVLDQRLMEAGIDASQVQIAWVKQAQRWSGSFPDKAQALQSDLEAIARNLKTNYPNLKLAYFSSRTRSFRYWSGLSPEPTAFETGFAVKWLIEDQINGNSDLNFDPLKGPVRTPYLSWGAYLWIDGLNARSDGMTWTQADLASDCTHPSPSGIEKVATMLLQFFKCDPTAQPWFLVEGARPSCHSVFIPLLRSIGAGPPLG